MSANSSSITLKQIDAQRRVCVATSSGIRQLRFIECFLDVDAVIAPAALRPTDYVESVCVWGRKDTAAPALAYARKNKLSVTFLEDGWVRSSSVNAHNRSSYSVIVDNLGVYYDSTEPSEIEVSLNASSQEFSKTCSPDDLSYAKECRKQLIGSNITKYNYCKSSVLPEFETPVVLVIDQTLDDASVRLGGMNAEHFEAMLLAAVEENPDATVIVRTHPDVVIGRRDGYLTDAASRMGITISADGDNPMPWIKRADRVYVGTSQIGYEALLCETPVTVFGCPFYAGWGLTDDRQLLTNRKATRTLDELFHVAHIRLARYINPVNGAQWTLHECLNHVQLQKKIFQQNAKNFICAGITPWKQGYVRQYLRSPDGSVSFKVKNDLVKNPVHTTWSFRHFNEGVPPSSSPTATEASTESLSDPTVLNNPSAIHRIEDGFLRSTGLGSDFTPPGSLVVDNTGLYFDPSSASDLETALNTVDLTPSDIHRAVKLRQRILKAGLSKYNVGENVKKFAKSAVNKRVLVVGQVEDDASIQRGCKDVADNASLLQAVRAAEPEAYLVYKPHPDVLAGNRKGFVAMPLNWANEVNTSASIAAGLDWCDELHTMTSLAGFEALMRNKRVVTYGMPFYAGWGLTEDSLECERRIRKRTLDELVYMTLIEYPRYLDVASGEFMTPEMMVSNLEEHMSESSVSNHWMHRQMTKVANIVKGCRYAP